MTNLLLGPWRPLPTTWYASVNDGASAFSVHADSRESAFVAAQGRLCEEILDPVDCQDPFAMDEAYRALAALTEKLRIYSGPEWTEHVLAEAQQVVRQRWPHWTPQGVA